MKKTYLIKYVFLLFFALSAATAFAQTSTISGKVVDEANQPLPGATVSVKGTQKSTGTDANGNFRLTGVSNGTVTIQITFVGYQLNEKTVTVSGNVTVNFGMVPNSKDLNEVVVIGYGTQKKKDLTGSITNVTEKDFNQGVVTSPEQLIQGKVAGLNISTNSGAPGAPITMTIRGGASVNGSNAPLIVIDGTPLSNDGISGVENPLDMINPNDIASFTILKDASAAAIYGNRASNGVIIITTKKGQAGAPKINFSTQVSLATLPKQAPVLSPSQFRDYVNANGDSTDRALLGNANTNWQDEIYQRAYSTNDNLSISGTAGHLPYRVSVGYDNQNGVLKTTYLQRYTTGINLSPSFFTDHLKINLSFLGTQVKQRFANEGGVISDAVDFNPTLPVYSGNSAFGGYTELLDPSAADGLKALAPLNPVGMLYENDNRSTVYRAISSLNMDYKFHFFPDLHAYVNFSYDGSNGQGFDIIPGTAASSYPGTPDAAGVTQTGSSSKYKTVVGNSLFEGNFNYNHDFTAIKSTVTALIGYSSQVFSTTAYNYLSYFSNGEPYPASVVALAQYPYSTNQYDLTSVYGRLNYAYDDKYLLQASLRSDVSTKFAPGIRTGNFPSVAAGWVISREDFLKGNTVLTNLKLRLEYGVTGNQDGIQDYDYLSDYSLSNSAAKYQFGNSFYQGYRPGGLYPGRTWEQTATANAGLDFGFLNDKISGTLDVYSRKTSNLLFPIPQAAGANFTNVITGNVGNMQDRGVELNLTGKAIDSKDITWTIGLNGTLNRNKITNLAAIPGANESIIPTGGISGGTGNNAQVLEVGLAKGTFYLYQQVYGTNGKPLDGVFVDQNGDGQINNQDLVAEHNSEPQEYFGLNSEFRYKQWNIGFSARAELGNYVYNNVASATGIERNIINPLGILNNGSTDVLTSGLTGNGSLDLLSDYYLQNASFFRMDDAHLGYNFGKVFKHTGDLKISGDVQNVFIITDYKGVDPEIPTNGAVGGIDNNFYPRPRTFVVGLNLSL